MKKYFLLFILLFAFMSCGFSQNTHKADPAKGYRTDQFCYFTYDSLHQAFRMILIPGDDTATVKITGSNISLLTNIKSGLDSLWSISESNNITTALIDSVNHTNDSLLTTYTNWVQWSFSADSSYEVDFNKNFTNPKTFTAGTAYTTKPLPISGHDKLYMRKKSTSAGYMHRNLVSEGK